MIKKVETIADVKAIIDIFPALAKAPIHGKYDSGLLDWDFENCLGVFYDDFMERVFRAYTVYAEHDDMTFIMTEYYDDDNYWSVDKVFTWHAGKPESNEEEIKWMVG